MRKPFCLAVLAPLLLLGSVHGHYHLLLPDKASVKKGETVAVRFLFGHPFEHQLFNASKPDSLIVLAPDGKKTNLLASLEPIELPGAEGKKVKGFQLRFTPKERGDYVLVAQTKPIWMEEDKEFLLDTVKVVLHVQAQKGWDGLVDPVLEWALLTRPYGLLPGMVFQGRVQQRWFSVPTPGDPPGALVEVERYNPEPPRDLPPDEFITRTLRTDPNGVATTTLTDPGWWSLTAAVKGGEREHEGKKHPLKERSTLWVYVQEKPAK